MAVYIKAIKSDEDPDILYYEVYKNEELLGVSETNSYVDTGIETIPIYYYLIAYDENFNVSDASNTLVYSSEVVGDINQDFNVNILDIVIIIDVILDNYYGGQVVPDYILNSCDINEDGMIDILDIVLIVNQIMDINLN